MESPESTGIYKCEKCGNMEEFYGIDSKICGSQRFDVHYEDPENPEPADPDYWDGTNADMGSYTEVCCRRCDHVIWNLEMQDPPELVAEALHHLKEARKFLRLAGSTRTLGRLALTLSSAYGAKRHADHWRYREERGAQKRSAGPVAIVNAYDVVRS